MLLQLSICRDKFATLDRYIIMSSVINNATISFVFHIKLKKLRIFSLNKVANTKLLSSSLIDYHLPLDKL